jgi:hypothetical protein
MESAPFWHALDEGEAFRPRQGFPRAMPDRSAVVETSPGTRRIVEMLPGARRQTKGTG